MGDIITDVNKYKEGWKGGLPETPCGTGSKIGETQIQRDWIPSMLEKYNIKTLANIGAGDLNWWPHMKLSEDIEVTHYDLVPRAEGVIAFDVIQEVLPKVDCLMLLWVLNHFPYDHCEQAIEKIKASGSRYLIMTDRPIWHHEQPPSIQMEVLEEVVIRPDKGDRIVLVKL